MDSIRTATEEFKKEWELVEKQHEHELNVRDIKSYGALFWHKMCVRWMGKFMELELETAKLRRPVRDLQEKGVSLTDDEQG